MADARVRRIDAAAMIDAGLAVVEPASVVVDPATGRIVDAGPRDDVASRVPAAPAEDWGDVLLIPGLVNGHAHTFQSLLRGPGDDLDFARWVSGVLYPSAGWLTAEDLETGALLAAADMLLAGITTVAEFFYVNDQGNANAARVVDAMRSTGIRTVFGRALYDGGRGPARYREAPAEAGERVIELAERYAGDPLVRVVPAPHSLHAASGEAIRVGAAVAQRLDGVFTIHVAEAAYEVEQLHGRTGLTPAAYLYELGALGPRTVMVHGVCLTDADLLMAASEGARIVHNPGANAFLGDGIAPLLRMRELGIPVALGTDGGCTNNRLSILDEMHLAPLLQRAVRLDGSVVGARDAFAMATVEGAGVFDLPTGQLRAGALADVVALDLRDPALMPATDLVSSVVHAASSRAVRRVMVHGRDVVVDGRLATVDLDDLRGRVRRTAARAHAGRA